MGMGLKVGTTMSDDINERLRDKTMQIVSLNQQLETLQAQLGGSQKRAHQLGDQVKQLQALVEQRIRRFRYLLLNSQRRRVS